MVIGSTIMPLSLRLTRSTSSAWRSIDMLRCMMPMPPCCASAMARCDSVTVSMAELTIGIFSPIPRVSSVFVSASAGTTSLRAGSSRTSSKVRPSRMLPSIIDGFFHHSSRVGQAFAPVHGFDAAARHRRDRLQRSSIRASICDLLRPALFVNGLVDFGPRFVRRMIDVPVSRGLILELNREGGVVILRLHACGLDPDVLDAGDLGGHGLHAVDRGLLLLRRGVRFPFHRHHVDDRAWLVERVLPRQNARTKNSSGNRQRQRGSHHLVFLHLVSPDLKYGSVPVACKPHPTGRNDYSTRCAC